MISSLLMIDVEEEMGMRKGKKGKEGEGPQGRKVGHEATSRTGERY